MEEKNAAPVGTGGAEFIDLAATTKKQFDDFTATQAALLGKIPKDKPSLARPHARGDEFGGQIPHTADWSAFLS